MCCYGWPFTSDQGRMTAALQLVFACCNSSCIAICLSFCIDGLSWRNAASVHAISFNAYCQTAMRTKHTSMRILVPPCSRHLACIYANESVRSSRLHTLGRRKRQPTRLPLPKQCLRHWLFASAHWAPIQSVMLAPRRSHQRGTRANSSISTVAWLMMINQN